MLISMQWSSKENRLHKEVFLQEGLMDSLRGFAAGGRFFPLAGRFPSAGSAFPFRWLGVLLSKLEETKV